MSGKQILLIEAFYGGSHKQLIDQIRDIFPKLSDLHTMPAKKWHWRSLTSPLHFSQTIPTEHDYRVLFSSSVLPLAELLALRPDLTHLFKIVYFHENQLAYPVRERKKRYFQHGYNDVLSCLVADKILFNSNFNQESFLSGLSAYFNVMPDFRPKDLERRIRPKCRVAYFPIRDPENEDSGGSSNPEETPKKLHILWPHRWEHDKDPETFFSVLYRLKECGEEFNLSVIGETFSEKPGVFLEAEERLKDHIVQWGFVESKSEYFQVLRSADVVVSTSIHEFFGVSMLEAVRLHCYPLCPNRLVYPEIYSGEYLYNTPNQLFKKLRYFCKKPHVARQHTLKVDVEKFSWRVLHAQYADLLSEAISHSNRCHTFIGQKNLHAT